MKMQKGEHSVVIEVPSDKVELYLQMGFHKVDEPAKPLLVEKDKQKQFKHKKNKDSEEDKPLWKI